jgi:Ribosomal protein L11 methyltransferase (PrmA)
MFYLANSMENGETLLWPLSSLDLTTLAPESFFELRYAIATPGAVQLSTLSSRLSSATPTESSAPHTHSEEESDGSSERHARSPTHAECAAPAESEQQPRVPSPFAAAATAAPRQQVSLSKQAGSHDLACERDSEEEGLAGEEEENWQHGEYFNEYGEVSIHRAMLSDRVRCEIYRKAIDCFAAEDFCGKVVLDLGCGTGLLSCFCARAGAAKVYAVEASSMANTARSIVRTNHLDHIVTVINERLEDTLLPEKVDVIVSEWMGCFLLFEGMLDSVLYARDHYLKDVWRGRRARACGA